MKNLENKKVLVTGAGGFIGSHVVEYLVSQGCIVRAFVHYNGQNRWGWLDTLGEEILSKIEIIPGDISDSNRVFEAMEGIDCVFHLAALIGIPYSYHAPDSYVSTNISGTLNVLQAARTHKTSRILVTSTSEVYGTARYVPIDEIHPRQPQSPYSATKIAADALTESFYLSFNLPVTIVRPFNTYGPRQSNRAVIPTIITQLVAGKKEIHLGSTDPTRDLVFVKDTAEGFARIAASNNTLGTDVNIATQQEIQIGELALKLINLINPGARLITDVNRLRPAASEVERLLGKNQKLQELTGWKPSTDLDEGLKQTIAWFRNPSNMANYKTSAYSV